MSNNVVSTSSSPAAIGPYSQAICANGFIFVSGQLPVDPKTGELVKGDVKAAVKMSIKNVKSILEAAGSSLDNVVKTTVYLKSMDDFEAMNEVYASHFTGNYPARVCFSVKSLPRDAEVEIEAIATVSN